MQIHTTIKNNPVIFCYFSKMPCKLYIYKVLEVQYLCFRVLEFYIRNFSKKKSNKLPAILVSYFPIHEKAAKLKSVQFILPGRNLWISLCEKCSSVFTYEGTLALSTWLVHFLFAYKKTCIKVILIWLDRYICSIIIIIIISKADISKKAHFGKFLKYFFKQWHSNGLWHFWRQFF